MNIRILRKPKPAKIEPLDYKETAVFHPNLFAQDNALIYWITGGVPHYINKLDVGDSIDEALLDNFFDRSSYLYEEPGNLLKQELREPAIYNAIIKAIAEGASRMNDIKMKVDEIQIIFLLSWVESVNGEGQTGRRKSRYRLISLEHLLKVRIISLARASTETRK